MVRINCVRTFLGVMYISEISNIQGDPLWHGILPGKLEINVHYDHTCNNRTNMSKWKNVGVVVLSDRRIHILEVNRIHTVFVDILFVIRVTMLLEIEVSTVCCLHPVFLSHVLVLLLYKAISIHHLGDSWKQDDLPNRYRWYWRTNLPICHMYCTGHYDDEPTQRSNHGWPGPT